MKKIPSKVIIACAFCAPCIFGSGLLQLTVPEASGVSRLITWLGIAGGAVETFSWGAREGYTIRGQALGIQIEHAMRCAVMSLIMVLVSILIAGPVLQLAFEILLRK